MTIWLFGSVMIFVLARVLGGDVNYSQCLGVIGYSVLPLFVVGLILPVTHSLPWLHFIIKVSRTKGYVELLTCSYCHGQATLAHRTLTVDSVNIWAKAKFTKSLSMYISESLLQLFKIILIVAELTFFAKTQLMKN